MNNNGMIYTEADLVAAVNKYGILRFWTEEGLSAWTLSGVNFNTLWAIRERVVNSKTVAYGKFVQKKTAFVSLELFPYLVSLRRDGYDLDSLIDEGRLPNREKLVMDAIGDKPTPSYNLGKSSGIKGYDAVVTSLQNKTYIALQFKKSMMGTALLCRPEDLFGADLVRSKYDLSPEQNVAVLLERAPGLAAFDEKELNKILSPAI